MGDRESSGTLSYGIEVITPDIRPAAGSAPGVYGTSMDTFEESLLCRDEREPVELALSAPPPG